MDLRPTSDQELLCRGARDLLARRAPLDKVAAAEGDAFAFDSTLWAEMASLGWLGLALPVAQGGSGGGWTDVALLCEELGRALCPAPFPAVAVAARAALEHAAGAAGSLLGAEIPVDRKIGAQNLGTAEVSSAADLVADVAAGATRPVLAVAGESGGWDRSPVAAWDGRRVTGRLAFVEAGAVADRLLVWASLPGGTAGLVLVEARGPGVRATPRPALAGWSVAAVDLDSAPAELMAEGWGSVDAALTRVAVAQAAWSAGAGGRLLEDTVAYVSQRVQFGVPIGSFQAVQHTLADCDIALAEAQTLARQASAALDEGSPAARRLASAAFLRSTEAGVDSARRCHQVWGGMGYSTDTHVHLFSRRAKAARHAWGGPAHHLEVVAEELLAAPLLRDRYPWLRP
ncbi:MAG: acyl-CoA dehydrogenase family protein [Acidimicrobiia bacterium]